MESSDELILKAVPHIDAAFVVLDEDNAVCSASKRFHQVFGLPREDLRIGMPMTELVGFLADHGLLGIGDAGALAEEQSRLWSSASGVAFEHDLGAGRRVEISSVALDDGGKLVSFTELAGTPDAAPAAPVGGGSTMARPEFLSVMGHEMRTPLNAILGFSQLLGSNPDEPLTEEQTACLDQIVRGGRNLLRLVDEVSELAKAQAGTIEADLEELFLRPVIEECWDLVAVDAKRRNITLQLTVSDELRIRADRAHLSKAVSHLLSNAVKYNYDNGMIFVSCIEDVPGRVRLEILDTGKGIPKDREEDVFRPFVRLESEEASDDAGSGMGLSVSNGLIEAMGGRMGFRSVVDVGSTFWVDLPVVQAEVAAIEAQKASRSQAEWLDAPRGKVVYVEDNPANTDLMKAVFGRFNNAELHCAEDAESGLELINKERPDLVLMDIDLPGMNGYEALQVLREDPAHDDMPIVAVSASAMYGDVRKGLKAGFDHYVVKPFDIVDLAHVIHMAQNKAAHG